MLIVVMLSVIMLNVVILNVDAPIKAEICHVWVLSIDNRLAFYTTSFGYHMIGFTSVRHDTYNIFLLKRLMCKDTV